MEEITVRPDMVVSPARGDGPWRTAIVEGTCSNCAELIQPGDRFRLGGPERASICQTCGNGIVLTEPDRREEPWIPPHVWALAAAPRRGGRLRRIGDWFRRRR